MQHEAFLSDFAAHETRVGEIGTLADELDQNNYYKKDDINQRYADIYQAWQELSELNVKRQAALDDAEMKQQRLDELRLQFAKQVAVSFYSGWTTWAHSIAAAEQLTRRVD